MSVKLVVGNSETTTTIEQITSVSETLAASINQKTKTVKVVSRYNDDVNEQFIGYLTCSLPTFTVKCILEVASLFEQYKCEKLLESALKFIHANIPLENILSEYISMVNNGAPSHTLEKILVESIVTPQTIIFEESFLNLPVDIIERIFSAKSDMSLSPSIVFAFIILEIKLKRHEVEPLMRFLDYSKLYISQLIELRDILFKYDLKSMAYLVIQMLKLRLTVKDTVNANTFGAQLSNSTPFDAEFREYHEFDGIFNILTKQFGKDLIDKRIIDISSSSNNPLNVIGTKDKKGNTWFSGDERTPFFQVNSTEEFSFNQYRFIGLEKTTPEDYALEISDDGENWTEIVHKKKLSSLAKIADKMGAMAKEVQDDATKNAFPLDETYTAKHIRLINYGDNAKGTSVMSLTSFEVFKDGTPVLGPLVNQGKHIISATASSRNYTSLIDRRAASYWYSQNRENEYIQIDFNEFTVAVTGYTLQTYGRGKNMNHLQKWVVLGSQDNKTWFEIDREGPNNDLNGVFLYKYYKCKKVRPCRYLRIRNEGENHNKKNNLVLSAVEFFGLIIPDI